MIYYNGDRGRKLERLENVFTESEIVVGVSITGKPRSSFFICRVEIWKQKIENWKLSTALDLYLS